MQPEIARLLRSVNRSAVRVTSPRFARLWDPPLHVNMAIKHMCDLVNRPPDGFLIQEIEGKRLTIEIRRLHNDH